MKYAKTFFIGLMLMPALAFGQSGTDTSIDATVEAGLTPDNTFYFLDRIGEMIQELLTFNDDAKIRLEIKFAKEREAEMKKLVIENGEDDESVEKAKELRDEQISKVKLKIKIKKEDGEDVSEWEKEIESELEDISDDLDQSIKIKGTFKIGESEDEDENSEDDDDDDGKNSKGSGSSSVSVPTTQAPASSGTSVQSYTIAQVALHNSKESCWSVVSGVVYDLTSWIGQHPGGSKAILSICGLDGTAAFTGQHSGQARPLSELAGFKIGILK